MKEITADQTASIYDAYAYLHPDADDNAIEAWIESLNAPGISLGERLRAYVQVCDDCMIKLTSAEEPWLERARLGGIAYTRGYLRGLHFASEQIELAERAHADAKELFESLS